MVCVEIANFRNWGFRPGLVFCLCLLTTNGTAPLPTSADAWRSETEYFCDVHESMNQGVGISGLALACLVVSVRAIVESDTDSDDGVPNMTELGMIASTALLWLVWSVYVVAVTAPYSTSYSSGKLPPGVPIPVVLQLFLSRFVCRRPQSHTAVSLSCMYVCVAAALARLALVPDLSLTWSIQHRPC